MDRRRFVKTSIMAALANPIHAMTKSKTMKSKKGHIAVVGAGAGSRGWRAVVFGALGGPAGRADGTL